MKNQHAFTEVRPKVFADPQGDEWRNAAGTLQVRERREDGGDLEPVFEAGDRECFSDAGAWVCWIVDRYPQSVPAVAMALALPMTFHEATQDDAAIQS